MTRRELLLLLGGVMSMARAVRAQQKTVLSIGFPSSVSPEPTAAYMTVFRQALSEQGYIEGKA